MERQGKLIKARPLIESEKGIRARSNFNFKKRREIKTDILHSIRNLRNIKPISRNGLFSQLTKRSPFVIMSCTNNPPPQIITIGFKSPQSFDEKSLVQREKRTASESNIFLWSESYLLSYPINHIFSSLPPQGDLLHSFSR